MKTYIQRGKVDVYITYEDYTLDNGALKYNRELASEYITCLKQMQQDFDLDYDIKVSTLSRYPEVLALHIISLNTKRAIPLTIILILDLVHGLLLCITDFQWLRSY